MGDIASSVLARLKNKAKESGKSYQLCLQLFCQEDIFTCGVTEESKFKVPTKALLGSPPSVL